VSRRDPGVLGLYVHVPYCAVRCAYCDFYLQPGRRQDLSLFVESVCREIAQAGREFAERGADTVHFGGGTPSLMAPDQVAAVLAALASAFALPGGAEIALEANPEDLDACRLEGYSAAGVNRLSIGVQSLDDDLLRLMRRSHDARGALAAVRAARRSRARSVGVDLILGLPGQTRARAVEDIGRVTDLGVDHVSVYLLEVHERTRLGREIAIGRRPPLPDDEAARLYEEAADVLEARGFEHYEISNFARPGHRSRHNLKYWTDGDYLGFGPSAHSYAGGGRWAAASNLRDYLARRGEGCARVEDGRSRGRRAFEALFTGLRLVEGVDLEALRIRYGEDFALPDDDCLSALAGSGLLVRDASRLRLTRRGWLLSNEVFERLLPGVPQLM
jgi:putative oxygen-independent coproporphyrinogen III oxidase